MYKLEMLVLTALAVAMVGVGALATAPTASAERPRIGFPIFHFIYCI